MYFPPFSSTKYLFYTFIYKSYLTCSFITLAISSHAVRLLPCFLQCRSGTLGHVWKCVYVFVQACASSLCFFFYTPLCVAVWICARVHVDQPICIEMKWNGRSCCRDGHLNGRYCWAFMICCWGFDSALWAQWGFHQPQVFFFPSFSQFLHLLQGSVFLASYHFIMRRSLPLTF